MRRITIEKIEKEITGLTPQEQLELVKKLVHRVRGEEVAWKVTREDMWWVKKKKGIVRGKKLAWSKLYGLGKGLWRGEDAQEYVKRLRVDRCK